MDADTADFAALINTGDLTTGPTMVELYGQSSRAGAPELRKAFPMPHVLEAFVGDFNKDGNSDLLLVSRDQASGLATGRLAFTVLTSDGKGGIIVGKPWTGPACDAIDGVADVNGDGMADIVVHSDGPFFNTYTTLFSKGDGTFSPSTARLLPTVNKIVEVADLNRDGKADFVYEIRTPRDAASGQASGLIITNGDGTGDVLGTLSSIQFFYAPNLAQVVLGDFNGDGSVDILALRDDPKGQTTGRRQYSILAGSAKGTFTMLAVHDIPSGLPTGRVMAADLNGDGQTDLVFTGGHAIAQGIAIGDPGVNGNFAPGIAIDEPGVQVNGVAVGDVNGDGYPDLIYLADGSLTVAFNSGKTASLPTFIRGYRTTL
jgi:hypothetical protein